MSKISDALAQQQNPLIGIGNGNHPTSHAELVTLLAKLISDPNGWKDLGANEFEVAQSIGRLIG